MAGGIRVQHESATNCRFTIVENDRPYPTPYQCTPPEFGGCGIVHMFKTHHLNLDDSGAAIVNDMLYQKIKHLLALNGFRETNKVKKPPTMGVGIGKQTPGSGAWGNMPIMVGKG
jgi:hypothetical protein